MPFLTVTAVADSAAPLSASWRRTLAGRWRTGSSVQTPVVKLSTAVDRRHAVGRFGPDGHQADAEGVVDQHAGESSSGLEVFGDEPDGAGTRGGFDDQRVPERQCVAFLE